MSDLLVRLQSVVADRYRIEREIGRGGMATVYVAQDLKHDRRVALKVMRPELAAILGGERFLREIRIAAKLNHPHILALHDSDEAGGFLYYVMPHVEGESLRSKLNRERQLGVDEAITLTRQVASALDYAHAQGVLHRDIKPENVLIHQGEALVADFGIALAVTAAGGTRITETGLSLGTPEYMSPEQATGERALDARSDVYSLGAVAYEMLVGEPPHTGNTVQAIIAKVVSAEPQPVCGVRHAVPGNVGAAVMCALAKTPADRFASGAEFADALMNPAFVVPTAAGVPAPPREGPWKRVAMVVAAIAVVTTVVALWALLRSPPVPAGPIMRVSVPLPEGERSAGAGTDIALSPDGTRLLYVSAAEGHLVLRPLDALRGTPIPGTHGARQPVFSPDGEYVAFIRGSPGSVILASISGAVSREVVGGARRYCLDWAGDGLLYFGSANGSISRVSSSGGEPELLAVPDSSRGDVSYNAVHVLPNGKGALFVRWQGRWDDAEIATVDFGSGDVRPLVRGSHPMYAASGHLVYVRSDSVLMAAPFDQDRLEVTGEAEAILDHVPFAAEGTAEVALSESGSLLYKTASEMLTQPVWVDRTGSEQVIESDWPQWIYWPALSPDDTRLAVSVYGPDGMHIWIKTLDGGPLQRLTSRGFDGHATWTPDGRFVTYWSNRSGRVGVWQNAADGSGSPMQLFEADVMASTSAWSPDGRWLLFTSASSGNNDVYAIRPHVDSLGVPLVATEFDEHSPSLSPDGRWLAYTSDLSGQFEVYVRPFPHVDDGVWQVSVAGGTESRWAHNGNELFYVNGSQEFVVVDLEAGPPFRQRAEHVLFSLRGYRFREVSHHYAVSHDDQRFIMNKLIGDVPDLMLVFNFVEELNRSRR